MCSVTNTTHGPPLYLVLPPCKTSYPGPIQSLILGLLGGSGGTRIGASTHRLEEPLELDGQLELVPVVVHVQAEGVPLPHQLVHVMPDQGRLGRVPLQHDGGLADVRLDVQVKRLRQGGMGGRGNPRWRLTVQREVEAPLGLRA